MGAENYDVKTVDSASHERKMKKKKNKRAASSDLDLQNPEKTFDGEALDGLLAEGDLNEPTMGEKLASLNLDANKPEVPELEMSAPSTKPPSADSVHVLLRQALNADDRVLLMHCLHTQDDKVIANTVSHLSPSDVLKLLDCLISLIHSRGAVLVCALPWLISLLLQHSSGIISQESSIRALNSLYQLIESRVSTFQSSIKLSSSLDYHFAGIYDDGDETSTITPTIYEDGSSDEDDELDSASETEYESDGPPPINGFSDFDESDGMME